MRSNDGVHIAVELVVLRQVAHSNDNSMSPVSILIQAFSCQVKSVGCCAVAAYRLSEMKREQKILFKIINPWSSMV
tara:strand:- start:397 stop:624 length:228 start_codon:yes stop_codon:yes gene_type:complete